MKSKSKRKPHTKSNQKLLSTNRPELMVKVSQRGTGNGLYLEGHGIDTNTGRLIPGTSVKRKLQAAESMDSVAFAVAYRVEQKYLECHSQEKPKADTFNEGLFTDALKKGMAENKESLKKGGRNGWNDETFQKTLTYCFNNVFPRLDRYGGEICEEDIYSIQEELIRKAAESKRGKRNRADAERSVAAQLYRADYIYKRLREQNPDLPRLDLKLDKIGPRIQVEQCKALPDKVRVQLAHILERLLSTPYGGLALAAAFMLFCGLRTSEAAGVFFRDIGYHDTFGSMFVQHQEQNGKITDILKTTNAYRSVILPKILLDFVDLRIAFLQDLGFSRDRIMELPIASAAGNPEILTRSNMISALVRELLLLCGITDDFLQVTRDLTDWEPDIVGEEKVIDVAAYILRRDFGTRACHICGFTMDEVDYLLGHAAKSRRLHDYKTPEKKKELAWKLERYVFDPDHSAHPAACTQTIEPGTEKEYAASQALKFRAETRKESEFSVFCQEPGDLVKLVLPPGVTPEYEKYEWKLCSDSPEARQSRPLIGALTPEALIRDWISEADEIDLSRWEGE